VSTLAVAIQGKRWELAALCLLMGVTEAAAALPPDAIEGLLEVLAGLEDGERRSRAPKGARTGGGRRHERRR
jgi:hypothetical protein